MLDSSKRCPGCYLVPQLCMCADTEAIPCPIELVVLRHVREYERSSNTGRLVDAAFANARILEYAHPDHPLDSSAIACPNSYLLFPSAGVSAELRPRRLVILDGSWSQARRMAQRVPELRGMPHLSLPPPVLALPRLRKGQKPEQMSTAEAVIHALRFLDHGAAADHLERSLRELVRRFKLNGHYGANAHHKN